MGALEVPGRGRDKKTSRKDDRCLTLTPFHCYFYLNQNEEGVLEFDRIVFKVKSEICWLVLEY
jgi:hypothetical protein